MLVHNEWTCRLLPEPIESHDSDQSEESIPEFFGYKIIPTLSEHSKIKHKALKRFPCGKAPSNDSLNPII